MKNLPTQIKKICLVQTFAWIGWFPFLFYATTYVGEIYADDFFRKNPHMTEPEIEQIYEKGTRFGTFALLFFSCTSFAASIVLPLIVTPTQNGKCVPVASVAHSRASSCSSMTSQSAGEGNRPRQKTHNTNSPCSQTLVNRSLARIRISSLSLRRAWLLSHLSFAALMWLTLFVSSTTGATILIGGVGVPWALTNWAPFALIAAEISSRQGLHVSPSVSAGEDPDSGQRTETVSQAGIVLGIHNVAIAAPQAVATIASSIIFKALQEPRGTAGDSSVGWVLRFGGLCAIAAAWCTRSIAEGTNDHRYQALG